VIDYFSIVLMFIGLFFIFTSALGVARFPDIYTRLHAVSKGTTFGFCFIILGTAFALGDASDIAKSLLAIVFQFITAPITGHMIARVALRRGVKPVTRDDPQQKLEYDAEKLLLRHHEMGD
jgi:multicomponent Na+:H+ antiporter subunit G